jgi:hypothetical protein
MEVEEREMWIRVDHLLNGEIKFGNDERLGQLDSLKKWDRPSPLRLALHCLPIPFWSGEVGYFASLIFLVNLVPQGQPPILKLSNSCEIPACSCPLR